MKALFLVLRLLPESVFSHVEGARDLSGAPFFKSTNPIYEGFTLILKHFLKIPPPNRIRISSYEFWKRHKYSYYNIGLFYKEHKIRN